MEKIQTLAPQVLADIQTGATEYMRDFALTGEYVKNLKNKSFKIVTLPVYVELKDFKDPTILKTKMQFDIEFADGFTAKYTPNNTSLKVISGKCGPKLINWINFAGEFYTAEQMISGELKPVVYVRAK